MKMSRQNILSSDPLIRYIVKLIETDSFFQDEFCSKFFLMISLLSLYFLTEEERLHLVNYLLDSFLSVMDDK